MKRFSRFFVLIFLVVFMNCQSSIDIISNNQTTYSIVVSDNPTTIEKFAAGELQQTILEMTNVTLPIIGYGEKVEGPAFFIGSIPELSDKIKSWHPDVFEPEEFLLKTENQNVYITGGSFRGVVYGVYTLLRDQWGCRWYTRQVSHIPLKEKLSLPALEKTGKPAFEYREVYFSESKDPLWCLRNRTNRSMAGIPDSLGGDYEIYPFVHTSYQLVPPKKYFKRHPEYFSLIDGKRKGHEAQLCLTNPDVLKIATKQVFQWIKDHPGVNLISIDQNDGAGWCQCEKCSAVTEAEGSQSATILNFVNAIADTVAKVYPDVSVQTLAYYYSEKPPKTIRPHKNVIIRLCRYADYCDAHPIEDCEVNKPFIDQINAWHKIAPKIMVWDYLVDFSHYLMPFPNFDGIKKDLKFYYNHGVAGLFEQGSYPMEGAEMADLRAWVLAQLLWYPFQDGQALIEEFVENVYGAAAPYILDYIELIHEKVRTDSIHFNMYAHPEAGHLTPDIVAKAEELFEQAEAVAAKDTDLLRRVEVAHLPIIYSKLYFYTVGGQKSYFGDESMPALRDTFLRILRENNIDRLAENQGRWNLDKLLTKLNNVKGEFITDWWLIGPFENANEKGLQTEYEPERVFDTNKSYVGLNGQDIRWQHRKSSASSYVDFTRLYKPSDVGVAYARTTLNAKADSKVKIGVGSNDGVRLWVNNQLVLEKAIQRKAEANQDILTVPFIKGENTILIKIDQFGGGWGFYFSILDGLDLD